MFSIEAIPHFHALPLQALPCLFSFLPILNLSQSSLSEWRQNRFSDTWGWLLPRIRSQLGHTPPTGPVWGFDGVVFLPRPLTGHKSPHRAEFGFSPQNEFTPPPKGEGLGIVCLVRLGFHAEKPGAFPQEKTDTSYPRASLGSCLWQLLVTAGSPWPNRAGNPFRWCRSPTRLPKPHTGPHRGEFGFGLLAGDSEEDHPPFRQSRVSNRAEEENTPALLLKIHPG